MGTMYKTLWSLFYSVAIQVLIFQLHYTHSQLLSGNLSYLTTNLLGTICPCKRPPKSTQCQNYDPQYAAATLEEVLANFVDTTTSDASKAKTILGKDPAYRNLDKNGAFKCDDLLCLGCFQALSEKIIHSLGSSSSGGEKDFGWINRTIDALSQKGAALGLGKDKKYTSYCTSLSSKPSYLSPNGTKTNISDILNLVPKVGKTENRPKRQSTPPTTVSSGTLSPIKCDYKRGDPEDSNANYCGLCNICWSVRTLPDKYFPRYINERTCDQSDNKCLSGYGTCKEIYRSIDVLYNYGTDDAPQWAQYSLNTPVSCECQVQADSAMYNFIKQ